MPTSPYVLSNYDGLFAGSTDVVASQGETILAGGGAYGVLPRGTVLGEVMFVLGQAAAVTGNTGDGTIGSVSLGHGRIVGNYTAKCTAVATESVKAQFALYDPNNCIVNTMYADDAFAGPVHFTIITGASHAFALDDAFTIPVAMPTSVEYRPSQLANVDGSENANAILLNQVDCTIGNSTGIIALQGEFVGNKLTFLGDDTIMDHRLMLRGNGLIVIKRAISAAAAF